ncbi:MAG: phosphodiester glycosidase family protein [Phormidesmis sp. CAN_BIN44]|nr:phosphodiester glycosidase family protein [Phormidesmis sp. CAN_BIN44]
MPVHDRTRFDCTAQRQVGWSIVEVTEFVRQLGVDAALNLDGGRSVTLAVSTPSGTKLLNSPIQNKIPMNERPIANHLGFYAKEK